MERFIEGTHSFPCRSGEKHTGLIQEVSDLEPIQIKWHSGPVLEYRPFVPEKLAAPISHDRFIHASCQQVSDCVQGAIDMQIVAVKPAKDKASSSSETFIYRRCLSVVWLRSPERELPFPGADHLNALIGATAIQHDIVKIRISLD
jgi:hypothetical protein